MEFGIGSETAIISRLAGGVPGQRFYPAVELPILVELLQKIHIARGVRFECCAAPELHLNFDRDDRLELLSNLLDNAGKRADEQSRCCLDGNVGRLSLVVEDDGPSCDDVRYRQLTERGKTGTDHFSF